MKILKHLVIIGLLFGVALLPSSSMGWGVATVGVGGGDVTAPVISSPLPTGEQTCTSDPRTVTLQLTTDENATCKYDTSDTTYDLMSNTFGTTGTTSHSQTSGNLDCDDSYVYYCRCMDGSGNKNTSSTSISFSIAAGSDPCASCTTSNDTTIASSSITPTNEIQSAVWIGYQFTIAAAKCITGGTCFISDNGTTDSVTFEIYTNNAGVPGARVGAGYTSTVANIVDESGDQEFDFAEVQDLPAGTYFAVIKDVLATSYIGYAASGSGVHVYSDDSGANWADADAAGYYFDITVLGCAQ